MDVEISRKDLVTVQPQAGMGLGRIGNSADSDPKEREAAPGPNAAPLP